MIIRKKNISNKKASSSSKPATKTSVIKKEDVILNVENIENTNEAKLETIAPQKSETKAEDIEDFEKIKGEILRANNDAVVIMGAGDIIKLKNLLI